MDKKDIQRQYHATRSAKLQLDQMLGVAPPEVSTVDIYRGVMPFVIIQLLMLGVLAAWPALVTWLPDRVYG